MIRNHSIHRLVRQPRFLISPVNHSPSFRRNSGIVENNSSSDNEKLLRHDIKLLGQKLGEAIKSECVDVYDAVEKLRKLGREVQFGQL